MRLARFVDGWNMYWSLRTAGIRPCGWCDFRLLARQQTGYSDASVRVKFFTAADKPNPDKPLIKQAIWWKALELTGYEVVQGEFRSTSEDVKAWIVNSGKKWREKMTDVALASHMVADYIRIEPDPDHPGARRWRPGYDEAVLLTQDSDFLPTVQIVTNPPFSRRVHVLLPPSSRRSEENAAAIWRRLSGPKVRVRQLSKADFAAALLPRVVEGPNGESVACHSSWMWREKYVSNPN